VRNISGPSAAVVCLCFLLPVAAACGGHPAAPSTHDARADFGQALELRKDQPLAAAAIFDTCGVLPGMERLRQNLYFDCLVRGDASPSAWRNFLEQRPSPDIRRKALLRLSELLIDEGEMEGAGRLLEQADLSGSREADRLRLRIPSLRQDAALRMLILDPAGLHRGAPDLEKKLLAGLAPEEALVRAQAWLDAGSARRAAGELKRLPAKLRHSSRWRLLRSRCERASGRLHGALAVLPPLKRSGPEEALARAEILRRIAWSRYPGHGAQSSFLKCAAAAALAGGTMVSLEVELECATEGKALMQALRAWRQLGYLGYSGSKKSRLGRRLGIALAAGGKAGDFDASSVPGQERCLRYWAAVGREPVDRGALERLADTEIPDLYGLWALRRLGRSVPTHMLFDTADLPPEETPDTVRWLLDQDEPDLAAAAWRHLEALRALTPGETIAACALEQRRGRPDLLIRRLRRAFPELGRVGMGRYPAELLRLYLPLRWPEALRKAAREAGIRPWVLAGLARQESIFNAEARSPAGAVGVVQLMPGTARGHARALGFGSRPDLRDPEINLRIGARELARLIRRFGALEPALAAYNGGESRVRRWLRKQPDVEKMVESIPVPETYGYVRRVVFLSEAYRLVWAEVWRGGENSLQSGSSRDG